MNPEEYGTITFAMAMIAINIIDDRRERFANSVIASSVCAFVAWAMSGGLA